MAFDQTADHAAVFFDHLLVQNSVLGGFDILHPARQIEFVHAHDRVRRSHILEVDHANRASMIAGLTGIPAEIIIFILRCEPMFKVNAHVTQRGQHVKLDRGTAVHLRAVSAQNASCRAIPCHFVGQRNVDFAVFAALHDQRNPRRVQPHKAQVFEQPEAFEIAFRHAGCLAVMAAFAHARIDDLRRCLGGAAAKLVFARNFGPGRLCLFHVIERLGEQVERQPQQPREQLALVFFPRHHQLIVGFDRFLLVD